MTLMSEPVTSLQMTPASSWARFCEPGAKASIRSARLTAQRPPPHAGPASGGGGDARGCRRDWYTGWSRAGTSIRPAR